MYIVTNLSRSPYTVQTKSGAVILPANESIKVDLHDKYAELISYTQFIKVDKATLTVKKAKQ